MRRDTNVFSGKISTRYSRLFADRCSLPNRKNTAAQSVTESSHASSPPVRGRFSAAEIVRVSKFRAIQEFVYVWETMNYGSRSILEFPRLKPTSFLVKTIPPRWDRRSDNARYDEHNTFASHRLRSYRLDSTVISIDRTRSTSFSRASRWTTRRPSDRVFASGKVASNSARTLPHQPREVRPAVPDERLDRKKRREILFVRSVGVETTQKRRETKHVTKVLVFFVRLNGVGRGAFENPYA